ncbi:hypothetical protein ACFL59_04580 [Planctomycetota bacterium]
MIRCRSGRSRRARGRGFAERHQAQGLKGLALGTTNVYVLLGGRKTPTLALCHARCGMSYRE